MSIFLKDSGVNGTSQNVQGSAANVTAGPNSWDAGGSALRTASGMITGAAGIGSNFIYINAGLGQNKVSFTVSAHTSGEMNLIIGKVDASGRTYDSRTGAAADQVAIKLQSTGSGYIDFNAFRRNITTGADDQITTDWGLKEISANYTVSVDWSTGSMVVTLSGTKLDSSPLTVVYTLSGVISGGLFSGIWYYTSNAKILNYQVDGTSASLDLAVTWPQLAGIPAVATVTSLGAPVSGAALTSSNTGSIPNPSGTTDSAGHITFNPAAASVGNVTLTAAKAGYTSGTSTGAVQTGAVGGGELGVGIAPTAFSIPENTTAVGTLTSSLSGTLTWSVSGGPDAARVSIGSASGVITSLVPWNYEAPIDADANNVYEIDFQVTNGTSTVVSRVRITVQNLPETLIPTPSPASGQVGTTITVTVKDESNFAISGAVLTWAGASGGSIAGVTDSSGQATITLGFAPGTFPVNIAYSTLSASFNVVVQPSAAVVTGVTISPQVSTINTSQTVDLNAVVVGSGGPSQTVIWQPVSGNFSVDANGLITPTEPGVLRVRATSLQNPSCWAEAQINVLAVPSMPINLAITPLSPKVFAGRTQNFSATINGASSSAVNWNAYQGAITVGGVYTAPSLATTDIVKATAQADSSVQIAVPVRVVELQVPQASTGGVVGIAGSSQGFTVSLVDSDGQPAVGIPVVATPADSAVATLASSTVSTDANGHASFSLTLGSSGSTAISLSVSYGAAHFVSDDAFGTPSVDVLVGTTLSVDQAKALAANPIDPKYPSEILPYVIDFTDMLQSGETLSGSASIILKKRGQSSADADSTAMLMGSAQVLSAGYVVVWVRRGLRGMQYTINSSITTSLGRRITGEYNLRVQSEDGTRLSRIV